MPKQTLVSQVLAGLILEVFVFVLKRWRHQDDDENDDASNTRGVTQTPRLYTYSKWFAHTIGESTPFGID